MNNKRFDKIYIIGAPGCGKTYIAKKLSLTLNIPMYDLDEIFWDNNANNYRTKSKEEDRDNGLNIILQNNKWIMEGVYYKWLKKAFLDADVIVILHTSLWIRHFRIIIRYIKRRLGLIKSKNENLSDLLKLLIYNQKFYSKNMIAIKNFIIDYKEKIIECNSSDDILKIFSIK